MCGIFGYVGTNNDVAEKVLQGLKRLEYRGYDSWGIAVKDGQSLLVEKYVGKIGQAATKLPSSRLGIGHTRWATHGQVTKNNAHPHLDCSGKIAVVHNGIVENFQDLKEELVKKGHKFSSQTDTEVVAHLVEEYLKVEGFSSSVRDAFNRLDGLNALVVAYAPSVEVVAAKTGSPLVVGVADDGLYVASDTAGILQHTRKIIFLEDNQMAILGQKVKLISLPKGKEIKPTTHNISWTFGEAEKGKFQHFYLKEVYEQPLIIENFALNYDSEAKKFAALIKQAFGTFMVACGSASHAALFGTYLFSKIAKKHINFSIGSEFKYLEDYLNPRSLIIPISQSGESIDVIEPVAKAKRKGSQIAAIVNVLGSTLYRLSGYKMLLATGPEKCVVATKSFTAMIAALLLITYTFIGKQPQIKKSLKDAADSIRKILKTKYIKNIQDVAKKLSRKEHIYILGRGLSYAVAQEAALKIKETSYVHAEGFAGGELKHGVIALIDKGTPCLVFAPNDETYTDIISNAQEVKARGAYVIGIGPKDNSVFDKWLPTADIGDATILPQVVVAQLLAYYMALARGIKDPDKPRNLAKSVTVR